MNMKYLKKAIGIISTLLLLIPQQLVAQVEITQMPEYESLEEMLQYGKTLERRPYRSGATGPYAFDCSGFTQHCFKKVGIKLNRTSADQAEQGKKIRRQKRLKAGDLVCFNGSQIGKKVGHVGIVVENKGDYFTFIHASTSVGITISNSNVKYYEDRYLTGRRITQNKKIRRAIKKFAAAYADSIANRDNYVKPSNNNQPKKEENKENKQKDTPKVVPNNDKKEDKNTPVPNKQETKQEEKRQENKPTVTDNKKKEEQKEVTPKKEEKVAPPTEKKQEEIKKDTIPVKPVEKDTTTVEDKKQPDTNGTNVVSTLTGPYHKVQKGDTLYNIAKRAGCTVKQLQEWNNLKGTDLSIDQVLRIKPE